MKAGMLYLHAVSPIHSGTGRATGVIDLPVAREKITGWPVLPGSSVKGVLRDACLQAPHANRTLVLAAFGPEPKEAGEYAGALTFTDGRLLCFPVRSLAGSFAWITCPLALSRWQRDHRQAGMEEVPTLPDAWPLADPEHPEAFTILVPDGPVAIDDGGRVYLEELDLLLRPQAEAGAVAAAIAAAVFADPTWQQLFRERFGIVADDVFTYLTTTATDVVARVRISDDTKTVAAGHLWWEEAVPAEAIFAGPVLAPEATKARNGKSGNAAPAYTAGELFGGLRRGLGQAVQIGGNASVGRGLVSVRLAGAPEGATP